MEHSYKFSVSHTDSSEFKDDGLRPFFQYRDLGIRDATNGASCRACHSRQAGHACAARAAPS